MIKSSKSKAKRESQKPQNKAFTNMYVCMLSCVWLLAIPWTVAHQISLSMRLSRQEYWSGLPFAPPGDWNHLPCLLHLQPDSLPLSHHQTILTVSDFSTETLKTQRDWNATFKVQKNKKQNSQSRILNPVKLPFRNEEEIKMFSDKQKLRGLLPLDLPYKKSWMELLEQKLRGINWKLKTYGNIKHTCKENNWCIYQNAIYTFVHPQEIINNQWTSNKIVIIIKNSIM